MRIPFATIPIATGRGLTTQRDYPQFQYLLDTVCLDPRPICMIAFTDARRFKAGGEMMKEGGIEIIPGFVIAEAELRERFSHSPGPGGQGVNTADSRVELMFDVRNSGAVPDQLRPIIVAPPDVLVDPSVAAWKLRNGAVSSRGIVNVRLGDEVLSPTVQYARCVWGQCEEIVPGAPRGVVFCIMT